MISIYMLAVIRLILKVQNNKMEQDQSDALTADEQRRVESAANLEGRTMQEAIERKKVFRYLY